MKTSACGGYPGAFVVTLESGLQSIILNQYCLSSVLGSSEFNSV